MPSHVAMFAAFGRKASPAKSAVPTNATRAQYYGPDHGKWLGPFSDRSTPDYRSSELPGDSVIYCALQKTPSSWYEAQSDLVLVSGMGIW